MIRSLHVQLAAIWRRAYDKQTSYVDISDISDVSLIRYVTKSIISLAKVTLLAGAATACPTDHAWIPLLVQLVTPESSAPNDAFYYPHTPLSPPLSLSLSTQSPLLPLALTASPVIT